jgi:hypothetical protein
MCLSQQIASCGEVPNGHHCGSASSIPHPEMPISASPIHALVPIILELGGPRSRRFLVRLQLNGVSIDCPLTLGAYELLLHLTRGWLLDHHHGHSIVDLAEISGDESTLWKGVERLRRQLSDHCHQLGPHLGHQLVLNEGSTLYRIELTGIFRTGCFQLCSRYFEPGLIRDMLNLLPDCRSDQTPFLSSTLICP